MRIISAPTAPTPTTATVYSFIGILRQHSHGSNHLCAPFEFPSYRELLVPVTMGLAWMDARTSGYFSSRSWYALIQTSFFHSVRLVPARRDISEALHFWACSSRP